MPSTRPCKRRIDLGNSLYNLYQDQDVESFFRLPYLVSSLRIEARDGLRRGNRALRRPAERNQEPPAEFACQDPFSSSRTIRSFECI